MTKPTDIVKVYIGLADNSLFADVGLADLSLIGFILSSGTTLDGALVHSSLASLDSDDHTQYILTDGSRSFITNVSTSGSVPTIPSHLTRKDYVDTISGSLQTQLDAVEASDVDSLNSLAGILTLTGADGVTVGDDGNSVVTVAGFRTEFVAASGSLQAQIDAVEGSDVDSLNSLAGTLILAGADGLTVGDDGSSIVTVTGFRTEFVSASGTLQTQIDGIDSSVTLQEAYDNGGGTISTTGGKPLDLTGTGDLTAVTGTFTTGLTIGDGTTYIFPDEIRIGELTASGSGVFSGDVNTLIDYNIGGIQVLSSTTLGSSIVNSSLTNVGTLTGLIMDNSSLLQFQQGAKIKFTGGAGNNFIEGNVNNSGRIGVFTDNSERISITLAGNIGIGNTLPGSKLTVVGDGTFSGDITATSGTFTLRPDVSGDSIATQSQIDNVQTQIDGIDTSVTLQEAYDNSDGIITTAGGKPVVFSGTGEFVAVTGTFTEGLTVGTGTLVITDQDIFIGADDRAAKISDLATVSGHLQNEVTAGDDEINNILNSLTPPAAPALDNVSATSASGPAGKNTWNSAQPISGYINLPADGLDTTFSASGDENGVVASGAASFVGILNDDVTAHSFAFPDNSFGEADKGTLQLLVAGNVIHSEDLSTFVSGATTNANGSGFTLSAAVSVQFESGDPFESRKFRTGTWTVVVADQPNGYNSIQVKHVVVTGTIQTNTLGWLVDDNTTATSYTAENLDTLNMTGSKNLSGVNYHTGGTAQYDITIQNAQRNTYRTGTPISFSETSLANIANKSLAATAGNEGQNTAITNESVTINTTRILDGSIAVSTNVLRTVQSSPGSLGDSIAGILMDNASSTSTDLLTGFDDENRRISSDENFATDLGATWDSTQSLVGADAGHNDGLQVFNSQLIYPVTNFSTITNGPGGNPNYSSAGGTRFFYGFFFNDSGTANFRLTVQGSATLIAEAATLGTNNNNVRISLRAPSETGWLDVTLAFIEGNFNDGDGCFSASLGNDQTIPTTNLGCTIGTKSTANSFDKMYFRLTVGAGWTGNLTSISIVWGAS